MAQTQNQQILDKLPAIGELFMENRLKLAKQIFPDLGEESLDSYLYKHEKLFDVAFMVGCAFNEDGIAAEINGSFVGTGPDFVQLFMQIFQQMPEFYALLSEACQRYEETLLKDQTKPNEN